MKIVLPSFDPSAEKSGTISNPLPGGKGRLIIRNDSGINLIFTFNSDQVRVLAQSAELIWLCAAVFTFTWHQETVLLNAPNVPISLVLIDAYTPEEPIPGTYPFAVPRVANIGNQVTTTGTSTVILTGETPPTDLVKSSPTGYTHTTIDIRDDGTITVYGLDAGVEKLLFAIAPSASLAVKISLLSAALGSTGQLTVDESGNLVTTGKISTDSAALATDGLGNETVKSLAVQVAGTPGGSAFVKIDGGDHFTLNGSKFEYVGFNSYDLAVGALGTAAIQAKLQAMAQNGATVVRTWAFGESNSATPVSDAFQYGTTGGLWNSAVFVALDNVIAAAATYGLKLILCLSNNWSDYGGKPMYATWYNTLHGTSLVGDNFQDTTGMITMYKAFIAQMLGRTNSVSGIAYIDDPTIMAWECINEGRYTIGTDTNPNTLSSSRLATMTAWYTQISAYIKSLDPNHLVSTGSVSQAYDYVAGDPTHAGTYFGLDCLTQWGISSIDYCDFHLYPAANYVSAGTDCVLNWTSQAAYLAQLTQFHDWAHQLNRPLQVGEAGIDKRNTILAPVVFYPRSQYFAALLANLFSQVYSGVLLWDYLIIAKEDSNFGITPGYTYTDPTIPTLNTSDTNLLNVLIARAAQLADGTLTATIDQFGNVTCQSIIPGMIQSDGTKFATDGAGNLLAVSASFNAVSGWTIQAGEAAQFQVDSLGDLFTSGLISIQKASGVALNIGATSQLKIDYVGNLTTTGTITGGVLNGIATDTLFTYDDATNLVDGLEPYSPAGTARSLLLRSWDGTAFWNVLAIGDFGSYATTPGFRHNGAFIGGGNSFVAGTGSGTFSHSVGVTPNNCIPMCTLANSSQTMGYDTLGSTSVHITAGAGFAWKAFFQ